MDTLIPPPHSCPGCIKLQWLYMQLLTHPLVEQNVQPNWENIAGLVTLVRCGEHSPLRTGLVASGAIFPGKPN